MQKAIRTYPIGYTHSHTLLNKALEDGFRVIMCNKISDNKGTEINEYIVEKEERQRKES